MRAALGLLLVACAGCLFHAPRRAVPQLSTGVNRVTLRVDARDRTYLSYVPERRRAQPALVIVLHASRQTAEGMRRSTGYAFDRLADEHGFVVAYPDGFRKRWNDCRAEGNYPARRLNVDDVGFVLALIDSLHEGADIDRRRVFLVGYSAGGQLAFRVALERPERVAALAAFSANLPGPENWACKSAERPVPALLVNGTADRINPFEGGEVTVFGFASRGVVRSSQDSAEYFAALAGLSAFEEQKLEPRDEDDETWVEQRRWHAPGAEVMLLAVHGGGHVVPGPDSTFPRILGAVSTAVDGPREAWNFFARQRPALAP